MTVPSALFPSDGEASPLLCLRVKCNVDELFKTLFVNPALQAQLHKLRSDTNFVETCWLNSKDQLPKPQYTWDAPADSKLPTASGRWRKVRFESPPTAMASKPFQNEEIHCCTEHKPGHKYTVEMQANTSAPYGDKFDLFFRADMFAASDNPSTSILHIVFTIQWTQAVSWVLKPVVTKAVEGGVRGAYKQYRQALEGMHAVEDLPETSLAGLLPEASSAAAVAPAAPTQPHAVPAKAATTAAVTPTQQPVQLIPNMHAGSTATVYKPLGFMEYAYGQLVWNEQVSVVSGLVGEGLRSASSQGRVARVMAAVVTLALIHAVVTVLHNIKTFCFTYSRNVAIWTLCTPVTYIIPLPDSLAEVLVSLLLVAAVNWAVIRGATASMSHVRQTTSPATLATALSVTPLERDVSLALAVPDIGSTPATDPTSTPAGTSDKAGADKPTATAATGKVYGAGTPIAHVSKAGPKRADIVPPKGRSQSKQPHSSRNKAQPSGSAGTPVVAPAVKAIAVSTAAGTSSPSTASAATTPVAATTKPAAQSMEMTVITSPATELQVLNTSKKADVSSTNVSPSRNRPGIVSAPQSLSNLGQTSGNANSKSMVDLATVAAEVVETSKDKEKAAPIHAASSPLTSQPASKDNAASKPVNSAVSTPTATPADTDEPVTDGPPLPRSTTPDKPTSSPAASQPGTNSSSNLVIPVAIPASTEPAAAARSGVTSPITAANSPRAGGPPPQLIFGAQYPPGAQPQLNGNASVPAWMKSVTESFDALSEGFRGAFGMSALAPNADENSMNPHAPSLDVTAGVDINNGLSNGGSGSSGHNNSNYQVVGGRYPFTMPIIGPDSVEEEVFENERIQPFRGWGHTWPGHFLPSDRVGHWSDGQGRPGGAASMVFEQVEPTLPPGYEWAEDEWQLDMEGLERDAVDEFGWTYAFDFQHLKHPPTAGAGKYAVVKHFVRRRRWFRTRVRTSASLASMSVANMHDVHAHEPGTVAHSPAAGTPLSTTSEPIGANAMASSVHGHEGFSKSFGGAIANEQQAPSPKGASAIAAGIRNVVGRAVASAGGSPASGHSPSSLSGNTKQFSSLPDTDKSNLNRTNHGDENANRPSITVPDVFAPQPAVSPSIVSETPGRQSTDRPGTASLRNSLNKSKRESSKGGGPPSNSSQTQQIEMEMSAIPWNPAWDLDNDLIAQQLQPPPSGSAPVSAFNPNAPTTGVSTLTETASVPVPSAAAQAMPRRSNDGEFDDLAMISQAGKRVSGSHGLGATRSARHAALGKATDRLLNEASSSPARSQTSSPTR